MQNLGHHGQMQSVAAAVALVDKAVQMGRGPEPSYVRVGWDQAKLQILTGLEEPSAAVVTQVGRCFDPVNASALRVIGCLPSPSHCAEGKAWLLRAHQLLPKKRNLYRRQLAHAGHLCAALL